MADSDPELALLGRLRAGDAGALEPLMQRYASKIYRLARAITRNDADAEEVVQDVFLTLVTKHETFEGRSRLSTWIYRVATNAALNKRRGQGAGVEVPVEDWLPAFKADGHREGERAFLVADWSQDPERTLLSREASLTLARLMDRLPEHYRAVLILRDVEELTNEEAAQVLGETVASVKSKLHRARMALREQLTRHFGPVGAA